MIKAFYIRKVFRMYGDSILMAAVCTIPYDLLV